VIVESERPRVLDVAERDVYGEETTPSLNAAGVVRLPRRRPARNASGQLDGVWRGHGVDGTAQPARLKTLAAGEPPRVSGGSF